MILLIGFNTANWWHFLLQQLWSLTCVPFVVPAFSLISPWAMSWTLVWVLPSVSVLMGSCTLGRFCILKLPKRYVAADWSPTLGVLCMFFLRNRSTSLKCVVRGDLHRSVIQSLLVSQYTCQTMSVPTWMAWAMSNACAALTEAFRSEIRRITVN